MPRYLQGTGDRNSERAQTTRHRPLDLLLIATHIAPAQGYGHAAESGSALAESWAKEGRAVEIVASNASRGGAISARHVALPLSSQTHLYDSPFGRRWGFGLGAVHALASRIRRTRAVYINGIATWPTTLGALFSIVARKRVAIALRGKLLSARSDIIRRRNVWKWAFYRAIALPLLSRAHVIHATSEMEARDAQRLLPKAKIVVAANVIDLERFRPPEEPIAPHKLTLLYVGRITPENGIDRFARIWTEVAEPGEKLIIAGSGEREYATQLASLAATNRKTMELRGPVPHAALPSLLREADFLVIPSGLEGGDRHEKFGNNAAEALASGIPLLIRSGLAWDAVEEAEAGILFSPSRKGVTEAIMQARDCTARDFAAMRRAARHYAERNLSNEKTAERLWTEIMGSDSEAAKDASPAVPAP